MKRKRNASPSTTADRNPPPALTITLSHHELVNAATCPSSAAAMLLQRANALFTATSYNTENTAPTVYRFEAR